MSIETLVRKTLSALPEDGAKEVEHYLEHGEIEMALEGLLIELTVQGYVPEGTSFSELLLSAVELGLDREQVFDVNLWQKFLALEGKVGPTRS